LGYVDGSRLAVFFAGELVGAVQRPAVAAAAVGATAPRLHEDQRGRQNGGGRGQLLESRVEHPPDESGVLGDTHGRLRSVA
jgi:hypothetical protein